VRIFMSHHSSAKPLVREVRANLPHHIDAWIDEHELLIGESLENTLREVIQTDADFLILFLDERAAKSVWVQTELQWALDQERRNGRPFILPILTDEQVPIECEWVKDRLCLKCHSYSESDIRHLASELSSALFAWLSRDLDILRTDPSNNKGRLLLADRGDALLEKTAATIRRIVFPYRRDHPLPLRDLLSMLSHETDLGIASLDELHELLFRLRDRKMISGIALTGRAIFVGEEHLNWRSQEAIEAKRAAAEYVVDELDGGQTVYLDAGSSTLEVCRGICRGVRFRRWDHLRIFTNSIPIAAEVSSLANELGLEDDDPRLRVIVVGGHMRLNTSALVSCEEERTLEWDGQFDVAVIGTNGVSSQYGCTTTTGSEAVDKRRALLKARRRFIMAEPSKYGVWQSENFASFDDQLSIVTAVNGSDDRVIELAEYLRATSSAIELVQM
jgi:DeoR/GlpR family transcriptional regulator of sugar metabolism